MTIRVLHLVKVPFGVLWAARLIGDIGALGIESAVVLPQAGPNHDAFAATGARIYYADTDIAGMLSFGAFRAARERLQAIVREFQPDIIHSHFVGTTLFARAALGRKHPLPRIFQVPGPLHLEHMLWRQLDVRSAGPRDYWLASCRFTVRLYDRAGVKEERVGLTYYSLGDDQKVPGDPGLIRDLTGVPDTTRIIGMVSYVYKPKLWLGQRRGIKGHEDLVDAASLLLRRGYDIQLVLVGGPWPKAEAYYERVAAYGRRRLGPRISLLGSRADVAALYPGFDVAVHPSHSENLGGAPESLVQAVPTVTTSVGGFVDLVKDGVTGWTVPPKSPCQLADAIAEVLDDPAEARRRAEAGRRLANEMFDGRRLAAGIVDFYRRVLAAA
jgi:glycosyltransferase involved in cell wall biosynthesis